MRQPYGGGEARGAAGAARRGITFFLNKTVCCEGGSELRSVLRKGVEWVREGGGGTCTYTEGGVYKATLVGAKGAKTRGSGKRLEDLSHHRTPHQHAREAESASWVSRTSCLCSSRP